MKNWENVGSTQPIVSKMLLNSYRKNRVAHAYIFEGGRGTGKRQMALLFAQTLFCKETSIHGSVDPCQHCTECKRILSGNHPDVFHLQPDGLSLKKDQIVQLQKEFSKTAMESDQKLYIVEHVDKMTNQAANSLLKFLEEPSSKTTAILLTERFNQLLPTIISRCQKISFQPIMPEQMVEALRESGVSEALAKTVASITNQLEEALSIIEEDWFAQARNIVIQLYEVLLDRPKHSFFLVQDKWIGHFKEREQFNIGLELLLLWYKDLLYIKVGEEHKVLYSDQIDQLKKGALYATDLHVVEHIAAILEAKKRLYANVSPQVLMEQLILRLQEG